MMQTPHCPDHERLMLDLALGRLEGREADAAERTRRSCPVCSAWWDGTFSGPAAAVVAEAVADAVSTFKAPRTRQVRPFVAAAAAVCMMAAGVVGWLTIATSPQPDVAIVTPASAPADNGLLFAADMESGDLSGWTVAGAAAPSVRREAPAAVASSRLISAGDFESGDLSGWTVGS